MPWSGGTWVPYEIMENATSPVDMMTYSNTVTDWAFGLLLLITIFIILFVGMYRRDPIVSMTVSLFVTTIVSIMLAAIDVVSDEVSWAMVFILIGSVALLYGRGGSSNV